MEADALAKGEVATCVPLRHVPGAWYPLHGQRLARLPQRSGEKTPSTESTPPPAL